MHNLLLLLIQVMCFMH